MYVVIKIVTVMYRNADIVFVGLSALVGAGNDLYDWNKIVR